MRKRKTRGGASALLLAWLCVLVGLAPGLCFLTSRGSAPNGLLVHRIQASQTSSFSRKFAQLQLLRIQNSTSLLKYDSNS